MTCHPSQKHPKPDLRCSGTSAHHRYEPTDQDITLTAVLAYAESQLLAQITDENGLDGRLTGVLAFNGALLAADVAAQSVLGFWWWAPIPALAVSSLRCFSAIFQDETVLGPAALRFYGTYGGHTTRAAREQLLADVDTALKTNIRRAGDKTAALRAVLRILSVGLLIASALIAFLPATIV